MKKYFIIISIIAVIVILIFSRKAMVGIDGNVGGVSDKVIYTDEGETAEDGMPEEYPYEENVDWVKEYWPEQYEMLKSAEWDTENDVWNNGNVQLLLSTVNKMDYDWPTHSYREVPWDAYAEDAEKFYGDRIWYELLYLNEIEIVEKGDERAEAVNNGEEFFILHTSMIKGDEKEILMFIMDDNNGNFDSCFPQSEIGTRQNFWGWYIGNDEKGNPVICEPELRMGG